MSMSKVKCFIRCYQCRRKLMTLSEIVTGVFTIVTKYEKMHDNNHHI